MTFRRTLAALCLLTAVLITPALVAGEVASANLLISGGGLTVPPEASTGTDIPAVVQTKFGGQTSDSLPDTGMTVVGDLTGPTLDAPVTLTTIPGGKFTLPPLHSQGDYLLQNIRLVNKTNGAFVQYASPSATVVHVAGVLGTTVTITQLTPDDLRARGISIDARNYDVYDYNFVFAINGQSVTIPYPVIVDHRTHQPVTAPTGPTYQLPVPSKTGPPPRFALPGVAPMVLDDLPEGDGGPDQDAGDPDGGPKHRHPVIPAAVIIPTGFGVLHQFFAVILDVSNNAPDGSQIELGDISATITTPTGLRVVKVNPAVTIGTPVPIYDAKTGTRLLVALAQGSADWSLEALRSGTHSIDIDVHATYKAPGSADVLLHGHTTSSIVVSDPRFQINFVSPQNVRAGEPYTAYAFITNTSPQTQNVQVSLAQIPACGAGAYSLHLCRNDGGTGVSDLSFQPGQTIPVPYKLTPDLTGHFYAAAGDAPEGITTTVSLVMQVTAGDLPLSPATLVLPYYTQFLNPDLLNSHSPLLGIGYSLATAPLSTNIANYPFLIPTDVYTRAGDLARAGERIFVARHSLFTDDPNEDREPIFHLSLDLLGNVERVDRAANTSDMKEWDQVRELHPDGRIAEAAMARELERVGLANGKSMKSFVDDFASATSHRTPFFLALAHGASVTGADRPYAMTVTGVTSHTTLSGVADPTVPPFLGTRTLPYGQLTHLNGSGESGELAIVGRWSESLQLSIVPAASSFTLDLIYPDAQDGTFIRNSIAITGATPTVAVTLTIDRGNKSLTVAGAGAGAPSPGASVLQTPLTVVGAAQDLNLDPAGHIVTMLFNRPVTVADQNTLRNLFQLTTTVVVQGANTSVVRKNNPSDPNAPIVIPGAAQQDDGRMINISFDHALSTHANYVIAIDPIADASASAPGVAYSSTSIVPRIDNASPGGVIVGKLLLGDGSPVPNALIQMYAGNSTQWDTTLDTGTFLFEFVPRDIDHGLNGSYSLDTLVNNKEAKLDGVIRFDKEVQNIVLQFLGRGSATGHVTYSDGTPIANAPVTIAAPVYNDYHQVLTNASGLYTVSDLPVGTLTFAVPDTLGNVAYATNQVRSPGEVVVQDLVIQKRELAGLGTVRVTVRRTDTNAIVPGAHVGVYTQGFSLLDGYTDVNGQFTFTKVPSGLVSILAAEFSITPESVGVEFDLNPDNILDQTLFLHVPTPTEANNYGTIEGDVKRDQPTNPNDRTADVLVPGAVVQISGLEKVTADSNGHYIIANVPVAKTGLKISAFDPATGRSGVFPLPGQLLAGVSNNVPLLLQTTTPQGFATFRVRLYAASGEQVRSYHVMLPGFPSNPFTLQPDGTYTLANVRVPMASEVWAIPNGTDPKYGDQTAHGSIGASFDGQSPLLELRLPGQGTVTARILTLKRCPDSNPNCVIPACPPTDPACPERYDTQAGAVGASYMMWSDPDQELTLQDKPPVTTDPVTGIASITKVPVGSVTVETIDHPSGYASVNAYISREGDVQPAYLKLAAAGDVTGRVVNYDGQSPVVGGKLTFQGSSVSVDEIVTQADGSFKVPGMAGGQTFRITAEATVDGIYRTGYVDGQTPAGGGPVNGLVIVMRQQASISGTIVDGSGSPIPQAHYWARELAWPYRPFGSPQNPLLAGNDGRFFLNNLFSGGVRITAESPTFQEEHGDAQVTIASELDNHNGVVVTVAAGAGTTSLSVTVVDSENAYAKVPNAEVTLINSGGPFDFGSADANGVVVFDQLPAGQNYGVRATSKVVGRSGSVDGIALTANVPASTQVALNLTGRVSGTVYDPDNSPETVVEGIPVYLFTATFRTVATTDSAGAFVFNGIPEGTFQLQAVDIDSGRIAALPPLTISKLVPDLDGIRLELETTATIDVGVYLPDDQGNSSGAFSPLADVLVTSTDYVREHQAAGAIVSFPKLRTNQLYHIHVEELGGEERTIDSYGTLPKGTVHFSVPLTFATTGTLKVQVTAADPTLVPNASVQISGPRSTSYFTNATGYAEIDDLPLGDYTVYVTSQNLSAIVSGKLTSHSQPLQLTANLGSRVSVDGYVDAELGGASVGTRVVADITSNVSAPIHIEKRTDANGKYLLNGVPVGSTRISLTFYGPDDITAGAALNNQTIADGSTGTVDMPRVKLDATPPSVVSLFPPNNANSVAPNAQLLITFSEPLSQTSVTAGNFQLIATDNGAPVPIADPVQKIINGSPVVIVTPLANLKSNTIYRYIVSHSVTDVTGNQMRADVSANFTTVDYTEPKITSVTPSTLSPIENGVTFRLKFNKPIDITSFAPGNGGVAKIEQIAAPGGAVINGSITTVANLDLVDPSTLILAPSGTAILPSSFYRVTVSGAKDTLTPPNVQTTAQVFEYASIDTVPPAVTIVSPVAAGIPLIAGSSYLIKVSVVDFGTNTPSKDIQYVDWFTTNGTADTSVARTHVGPDYGYLFVVPANVTKVTLKASATDLSQNTSALASYTWDVTPNLPPQNVTLTPSVPSVYLNGRVDAAVSFSDEGTKATINFAATGQHADGSAYPLPDTAFNPGPNPQVSRPDTVSPWPLPVTVGITVPSDVQEGTTLHLTANVVDSDSQTTTQHADVNVLVDNQPPVVVSIDSPKAESTFLFTSAGGNTFPISVKVKDAESGIARVHLDCDKQHFDMTRGAYDQATGTWTFTATGQVVAKNADTRIHVVVTAYDYHGNSTPGSVDVIFQSVNDGTVPVAQWLTPLDSGALPADTNVSLTLRVHATDDVKVQQVLFTSAAFTTPYTLTAPTKAGDIYEQVVTFTTPHAGTPVAITATVSDSDTQHDVVLPITLDVVAFDTSAGDANLTGDASIGSADVARYTNRTLIVSGSGTNVYITSPLTLKNLIVMNGGHVGNTDGVKLDLTVTDHLFVDADSSIDVSGKGYLGGYHLSDSRTHDNTSSHGVTLNGTTNGAFDASASYGGIGGQGPVDGLTNATYGSIQAPGDFGSGGSGDPNGTTPGGSGGGAVALHGGSGPADLSRFVIAGVLRADGETGVGRWGAGSGGSVLLSSRSLITGPSSRITANGGDDEGQNNTQRGGGGGRISVQVTDRFDLIDLPTLLQSRGGRNLTASEGHTYVDGGAGTLFLQRPGESSGELIISSYDDRYPSSTHYTFGTPLSAANGTLTFGSISVLSRALARFDDLYTVADPSKVTVDAASLLLLPTDVPTVAMTTTPSTGADVIQGTTIVTAITATSPAGVGNIGFVFSGGTAPTLPFYDYPASATAPANTAVTVAPAAAPGPITLKAIVTDRSGRTAETAVSTYNVIANTAPQITQFDVTPASLYAGHSVSVTAAATDDISVTSLQLTADNNDTVTPSTFTAAAHATRTFTVAIPPTAANGTTVNLTLSVADAFPGRAATTQTKSVAILVDTTGPTVAITQPQAPYQVNDGAAPTLTIEANATDAEVGVQKVTATFDGVSYDLVQATGTNLWTKTIPVAHVFGTDPVQRILTVKAYDYANNSNTAGPLTVTVIPSVDPNGPAMTWTCASPGAMYPAGSSVTLKVFALSPSGADAQVQFQVDGGALVNATPDSTLSHTWNTTLQIPAGDTPGTQHTVVVIGTATGGHTSSLFTTVSVIGGTKVNFPLTIDATDTSFENGAFYILSGGSVTVTGAHHFANVAVLEGGSLIQKHADLQKATALTIDNLYVACAGFVDTDATGYAPSTAYPGAGTPGDSSGGGHMGRGGVWGPAVGGTFGSVYHPLEAGGGGQLSDPTYAGAVGGGIVRIIGTNITVDGTVRANAQEAATWGSGAGGSVYLTASHLFGNGSVQANGATWSGGSANNRGAGGGGAIALEYDSAGGTILNNVTAMGGIASGHGAAGTVFVKTSAAQYGDLTVNNGNRSSSLPSNVITDLPAFGLVTVTSTLGAGAAVIDAPWEGSYLTGNSVRVIAPDGTVRGAWKITSIANDASVRTVNGVVAVPLQGNAYDGYLMYSDNGYTTASTNTHVVAVRNNSGTWQYDTGSAFTNFTPATGDKLFASFSKTAGSITALQLFTCNGSCTPVAGLPALALVRGEVLMNAARQNNSCCPIDQPIASNNSFFLDRDSNSHGLTLSGGTATVTLESGSDVRVGDTMRGVYLFDHVNIKNARVYTPDLFISTNAPSVDANSTFVTGNLGAPVVDVTKLSLNGGTLVATAGAITDPDTPIAVTATNQRTRLTWSVSIASGAAFTVNVFGAQGDSITVRARDAHVFPLDSGDIVIGTLPVAAGVASVTTQPATVPGGATTTVTVTLDQAAPVGGAVITLTSSNPLAAPVPTTLTVPAAATSASFSITTPSVVTTQTSTLSAAWVGTSKTSTLMVVPDTTGPSINITAPTTPFAITEGQTFVLSASITDDVGVRQATATIDGVSYPMALDPSRANIWNATITAPDVDGTVDVPKQVSVTATDLTGNPSPTTATFAFNVHPIVDALAPTLTWVCGSTPMYPAGASAVFSAKVTAATGDTVNTVSITITGGTAGPVTVPMSLVNGAYQATVTIPSAADGTVLTTRVLATTFAGKNNGLPGTLTVIDGTPSTTTFVFSNGGSISATDTQYETHTVIVSGGTLTIAGNHTFGRLIVIGTGNLTHAATVGTTVTPVNITANIVFISCGATIDVSSKGYGAATSYPGATAATAQWNGGSHLGFGGVNATPAASTFGSVYQPQEPGGGGNRCCPGGGVVTINAPTVTNDGVIKATGAAGSGLESGAGGSVWIHTTTLGGNGSVAARGGDGDRDGGGGAIAIEYSTVSGTILSNLDASGGSESGSVFGGAGTVFIKGPTGPSVLYGSLTVDGKGHNGRPTQLPWLGYGVALAGSGGATLLTDRAVDIPAYFIGNWVEIKDAFGVLKGTWRILPTPSLRTVVLAPNGTETINIQQGDQWRGIYRFDNVTITNATLDAVDRVDSTNAIQLLSSGSITGNNQGAPLVNASKISISSQTFGPVMTGLAGAVTDSDTPISVFAVNQHTGLATQATVAADGSFANPLRGSAGDSIYVYAKDSNFDPMQSQPIFIGTLPSSNITPVSFPITSSMTTDGSFKARRLAVDGNTLVAQTYPASTDDNKIVIFDLSTGTPVWLQTLANPANTRDVAVRNNTAYVAANQLYTYDLSVNPATRQQAGMDCGDSYSVAVDGTYAYVGGNCNDGHIAIYDVTNPKQPVYLRAQGTGITGTYTQLILNGNYLIGISPTNANGVVIIDRRDTNNLVKTWQTSISGFTAVRGSLQGSTLYVTSAEGSVAVVDVSVPTLGVVKSVYPAGSASHGIQAIGSLAFTAADTNGVIGVNAANPSSPTAGGGVATTPQAAWDIVMRGQLGIIAAEDRLLTFSAPVQPQVNASRVTQSFDGHTVTVHGAAFSILGAAPLTADVRDETSGVHVAAAAVAADGSFSASLVASAGDVLSIVATDANGLTSGVVRIGVVPFGTSASLIPITTATSGDGSFRARHMAIDGSTLAVVNYPSTFDTNKLLIYSIATGTPVWLQTLANPSNTRDVAVRNNVAYVAGGQLYAYDLSVNPATRQQAGVDCGDAYSVAVDGTYAYVGGSCNDGHVAIYDVTNPKQPVYLRAQGTAISGTYTQLIPYGNYLIGITPNGGVSGVDVVVLDRRDVNNLIKVSATAIPNITAFRGTVLGNMLYAVNNGYLAAVDLTNVVVPTYTVVPTVGLAFGVAVAGNTVAVGDGGPGVSFFDVTTPAAPRLIGTQNVGGSSWDLRFAGGKLYVANEEGIAVINGIVAPPVVDTTRVTITRGTSVTVAGTAGAITGAASPMTATVRDETSGGSVSGVAIAADGSFSASLVASAGDVLSLVATDANGLTSGVVRIGVVPFGTSASLIPITTATSGDGSFRARHMAIDGSTLAVVNYPSTFDTNKLLIYSIATGTPVWLQTLANPSNTRDVAVRNNVAYVAGGQLYAYDLSVNPATRQQAGVDCGDAYSVAVDGTYAYVGGSCNDGHVAIYDVTNPKQPVYLRAQGTGISGTYTQLIPYGNYLIGITPNGGVSGVDVVVLDRRDVNNLIKVSATPIPNITAFRGAVLGNMLYTVDNGYLATVDLTNVALPTYTVVPTVGLAAGVAVAGNTVAVGDGGPGVTFFDVTAPAAPRLIGTQNVGGSSWDLRFAGGKLYVANEEGIAVINSIVAPPVVDTSRVTITHGGSTATVAGGAGAVTGAASPITATVRDETSGASVNGVAIAADGSFSTPLAASAGDVISIVATDANGATSGVVRIGAVPFGTSAALIPITTATTGDGNFRARHMAIDGSTLAVINYPSTFDTNKLLIYSIATGTPVWLQTVANPSNTRDVAVRNNVAYVAGGQLYAYDLSVNPATRQQAGTDCGDAYSVAVDGTYAYVGGSCNDGHVAIYDVTNPKQPVYLRAQGTGISGIYTQLIPYGNYLIGITPNTGVSGVDVVVLDRRDVNNLINVSATPLPNITAFRGTVLGNMLYAVDNGYLATVDLTNVALPTYTVVPTVGLAAGVAVAGTTVAVGDGGPGVTFFDVTTPAAPRLIGTQNVGGSSWDLRFAGGKLYVANEEGIAVINSVVAPPVVDTSRVTITRSASTATVAGGAGAVTGAASPITATVRDETSGASVSGVAIAADGSFSTPLAASAGDVISIVATDANGATSLTIRAGSVPFGPATIVATGTIANDGNYRARRLWIDGNTLATANYPYVFDDNKVLVFDISSGSPVWVQTLANPSNTRDIAVRNSTAYVAGGVLYTYDLSVNPATRQQAGTDCGDAYSVAVDGTKAFVGGNCGDGHIAIYDLTNPKQPVYLRAQGTGSGVTYTQLIPYGTNQLVAISPSSSGGRGHDVVIIDRTNVNNLVTLSDTDIPNVALFRARIVGHMLYGASSTGAVAILDLSNLATPAVVIPTPGVPRALEVDPLTLRVYVADSCSGVTVIDASNPGTAHVIGTQPIGGEAFDAMFGGSKLYVAAEQLISAVDLSAAGGSSIGAPVAESALPPAATLTLTDSFTLRLDSSRVTIVNRNNVIAVRGERGAVTGPQPITAEVRNLTLGTSAPVIPVSADGAFEVEISAAPGDHLRLVVTSGDGKSAEIDLGEIPEAPRAGIEERLSDSEPAVADDGWLLTSEIHSNGFTND